MHIFISVFLVFSCYGGKLNLGHCSITTTLFKNLNLIRSTIGIIFCPNYLLIIFPFTDAFGVTEAYMDQELCRFIASGRLHAKIDKVYF